MNFRNELLDVMAKSNAMVKDTAFLGLLLSDHLKPDFNPLIIKSKDRLYHEIKEVCGLQKITEEHLSQVFISIALILGDGLYNFIKVLSFTIRSFHGRLKGKDPQNRLLIIIGVILLVSSSHLVAVLPWPLRPFLHKGNERNFSLRRTGSICSRDSGPSTVVQATTLHHLITSPVKEKA